MNIKAHSEGVSSVTYPPSSPNPSRHHSALSVVEVRNPAGTSEVDLEPVERDQIAPPSIRSVGEGVLEREYPPSVPREASNSHRKEYIQFAALCWSLYLEGWNDGSTGPLLPAIQNFYHIGFATVSLIFVSNCIASTGFLSGAVANVWLNDKLGLGKVLITLYMLCIITYSMQAPAGPFPVIVVGYCIGGFGIALQNAQANGFVSSLSGDTSMKLGLLHGAYGLGAFSAPLAATYFSGTRHWSFHFLISVGMAVLNTIVLSAVFRFQTQEEAMAEAGQAPGEPDTMRGSKYRHMMGQKSIHFLALFCLIYVGVEVRPSWIVTFIERERGGGPSSGYISSGFFAGLTIGRLSLLWINRKVGERRVLFIYALIAIGLEITIWAVPSLIENAVAVAIIGVLLGPMYPILVSHASRILPKWLITGAVGWIAGVGQAGSAVLPFTTGVLASKFGIGSLQPLLVTMMCVMVGLWALVPASHRRRE
ncbi:hypothetical protein JAAARDRAFT_128981 [Jaapia argillacea MUCL 33604]|uniref:Major facilitator superfamily (MFS) profile domain-containing protein n=1 Tax=Jaapia argillacea MUCL 33604 TaxID=933084 RepID=A0A067PUH3_9AGAM|nr:hypothetical protein JAAARDRAFT_128981 [Jaapia argillacea MUCL 33604]